MEHKFTEATYSRRLPLQCSAPLWSCLIECF